MRLLLDTPPPAALTTGALVLAFSGDSCCWAISSRGPGSPGDHIETGATLGTLALFAAQELRLLTPRPATYRPPHPRGPQRGSFREVACRTPDLSTPTP